MALVDQVTTQEPYASAKRVFWVVDNGSSHRGKKAADRLRAAYPNVVLVHTPVHASWLNQVEIYFSVVQRKVVTPNDFTDLNEVADRLRAFEDRYNATAQPGSGSQPRSAHARRVCSSRSTGARLSTCATCSWRATFCPGPTGGYCSTNAGLPSASQPWKTPVRHQLLHRFATWHQLRRLRAKSGAGPLGRSPTHEVRQTTPADAFLTRLAARVRTLDQCRQADLDAWHADKYATGACPVAPALVHGHRHTMPRPLPPPHVIMQGQSPITSTVASPSFAASA